MLAGEGMTEIDARGRPVTDGNFLILFNAHHEEISFALPNHTEGLRWLEILDTARGHGLAGGGVHGGGSRYPLRGRSLALLQELQAVP
jgi:glycogen operon protein